MFEIEAQMGGEIGFLLPANVAVLALVTMENNVSGTGLHPLP